MKKSKNISLSSGAGITPVKVASSARKKNDSKEGAGTKTDYDIKIGNKIVHLSNQDKIYWPDDKYTKGDLIDYYDRISEFILPYLKDRPQSMHRFPNGINGPSFFHKDVDSSSIPDWLKTREIYSISNKDKVNYLVCNDKASLLYMANLGCIEINPWNSRIYRMDHPDWLVLDLDPEKIGFEEVIKTARVVKKTLDHLELNSYLKTSGATGLHIFIPLNALYNYQAVKSFAHLVALKVNEKLPHTTSILRVPSKRNKKVYLDFLQNSKGQTIAAPYSVRPRPGAPVSTPLKWSELTMRLRPENFTIKTIFKRLDKVGDLWAPVLGQGENILHALKFIQQDEA